MRTARAQLVVAAGAISTALFFCIAAAAARSIEPKTALALASSDPKQIATAIEELKKSGNPKAVNALAKRIRSGLPPTLVESAIDAIIAIRRGPAAKTLSKFSAHRMASVRIKVAFGLADMRAPGAMRVVTEMLDDTDPGVRGAAAKAIGELGIAQAIDELIEAVRLGLPEAGEVLAAKARPADVSRILKKVNSDSLEAFASVLGKLVQRKNLPQKNKLAIVEQLGAIGTPLARQTLLDFAKDLPPGDPIGQASVETLNATASSQEPTDKKEDEVKETPEKKEEKAQEDKRDQEATK